MNKKEFMYCFQISGLITFEVRYYTLDTNTTPYFATSANEFIRSKRDYCRCGQAQADLLPKGSPARRFWQKWDPLHLKDLTPAQYEEMTADIEKLKANYNYIEDVRECFGRSAGCYKTHIPFYEIAELSKQTPKAKQKTE